MSLPWAARGLKIPYVVRNDWQSRGLAMAAAAGGQTPLAQLLPRLPSREPDA
ncbi:hypothetical protein [Streptomyces sp. LN590]|uniref:hypothetical protein n=1 Tax=Streptomyces sp. LN590 TaxID=3112980 RepID=UPI00371BAAA3